MAHSADNHKGFRWGVLLLLTYGTFTALSADTIVVNPKDLIWDRPGDHPKIAEISRTALENKEYDALDSMEQELITNNRRFPEGLPQLTEYYNGLTDRNLKDDAEWKAQLQDLQDWCNAKPDSILAASVLADALNGYAWFARGDGYANTITEEGGKQFDLRLDQSRKVLEKTYAMHQGKNISPLWYSDIQTVALGQGWTLPEYDRWFNEGVEKYPDYYGFFFSKACYLLPRWYGEDGAWEKFAENSGKIHGIDYYTRICWSLSVYYSDEKFFNESQVKWDLMKAGFEKLMVNYPTSLWNLNNFCHFACLAGDKETAGSLFKLIDKNWYRPVWHSQKKYQDYRHWALPDEASPAATPPEAN